MELLLGMNVKLLIVVTIFVMQRLLVVQNIISSRILDDWKYVKNVSWAQKCAEIELAFSDGCRFPQITFMELDEMSVSEVVKVRAEIT
jgi:hypothetical protein